MEFEDFPFLGIWTKAKAPFVCLEPWLGLADSVDASGYLLDKEGIQVVMPQHSFSCSYQLTFN
jgi:galactose mutarotase-like enzyme